MSHPSISKVPNENAESDDGTARPAAWLESLGVTRVISETFAVGGYSYTNLADAVAQGRRMQATVASL